MKILQINNCHYRRGGADVVYLNTGNLLESFGNQVFYFSTKSEKNQKTRFESFFVDGVDFINMSLFKKMVNYLRFFYYSQSKKKLNDLIVKFRPDIAHIHLYKGGLTPSILNALKNNKVPIVVSLHDYGFLDPHNLLLDGNLNISEKCINGSVFNCFFDKSNRNSYLLSLVSTLEYLFHKFFFPFDKCFDTIVAVSKFSQSKHLESNKFKWSIDHLYNFSPLLNQKEKVINNQSNYLLYFGRLSKEKGIKTLIKAIKFLNKKIDLYVVGTGELDLELKKYISENNLLNVKLLGFKSGADLYKLIREAKFVVVPSEWYENNPMTIIEAYCFGVPVIGSRVGGIPEIIHEDKTGYTFNMGDVKDLSNILNKALVLSESKYNEMKKSCRLFAKQNFSPNSHYEKLMKLYQKTINKTNND